MLPLHLLSSAQGKPMLIELKNGETYNGHLVSCDSWMNINLKDVICTSPDGNRFFKYSDAYVRGNMIKYLRIPDDVIEKVRQDIQQKRQDRSNQPQRGGRAGNSQRGARGQRGNHRGQRGGRGSH